MKHRFDFDSDRCICGGVVVYFEDGPWGEGCEIAGVPWEPVFPVKVVQRGDLWYVVDQAGATITSKYDEATAYEAAERLNDRAIELGEMQNAGIDVGDL